MGDFVRNLIILVIALLNVSCTLLPVEIHQAPVKQGQAVVFDIDGTLTPKPFAIFAVRDGAANAARLFSDKGYKIIYLSARIKLLQAGIPKWLKENGFPEGSIHVPQTVADSIDHATFKKSILNTYKQNGWEIVAAFGDSSTDFDAYAEVGLKKDHVFALQREGRNDCQPGFWVKCFSSWDEHTDEIIQIIQLEN